MTPPVLLWSCDTLCAKLLESPYANYAPLMRREAVNGASVLQLTQPDTLVALGVRPEHSNAMAA